MLDVLIIGAGPIGMACAIEAQKQNLNYLIVEKGTLVNSLYHYPHNMTFFSSSEKLEIGDVPFVSHNPKPTRAEALEYYRRVAMKFKLRIKLYEEVKKVQNKKEHFEITTSKNSYTTRNIIVASGFYDLENKMGIPGEELPKVKHYYREPHPYFQQKIAVIGAQNSAVDVALECWRKGAEVTMIIRGRGIADRVKYWVRPDIENRIKEGSIKAYFNAEVVEITPENISFKQEGKVKTIPNDFVMAMTGYRPNFDLLKSMGVMLQEEDCMRPVYNAETMETNIPGIFLAGVICGGLETHKWFIENSRAHAKLIINHLSKKPV